MSGCTAATATCEHHYATHVRGGAPISVRICSLCGQPDFDDLTEQADRLTGAAQVTDEPRLFYLDRDVDVTGVSGDGRVADGVVWPNGWVTLVWRGDLPSVVFRPDIESVAKIHGHDGRTRLVFHD